MPAAAGQRGISEGTARTPGSTFILPGKALKPADGYLQPADLDRAPGKRVAVDLFFRSLADTHGPHAGAVVLSGGDGDGAIGIKRIKERGGLTIAQDPDEAEHASMPAAAIATGMVDWVLPVAEISVRACWTTTASSARCACRRKRARSRRVAPRRRREDDARRATCSAFLRARTGRGLRLLQARHHPAPDRAPHAGQRRRRA